MNTETIKWDGKQITKPGLYGSIPLELYHAGNICDGPSVSSSGCASTQRRRRGRTIGPILREPQRPRARRQSVAAARTRTRSRT